MRIDKLHLENFRGFEDLELELHDQVTVLIGVNGSGKTALLDALAIALGGWTRGTAQARGAYRRIRPNDARLVRMEDEGLPTANPTYPVRVSAEGKVESKQVSWNQELRHSTGRMTSGGSSELRTIAEKMERVAIADSDAALPILAYYGTSRLWVQKRDRTPRQLESRMQGYVACLEVAQDLHLLQHWMKWREEARIQSMLAAREEGEDPWEVQTPHLDAVAHAAASCLEGVRRFYYSMNHKDLRLDMEDGRLLPFDRLSDGERSLVVLAADIAWRTAQLNPGLGKEAPQKTSGVVLIDEVELHLHPAWQRQVIDNLTRVFPKVQFVLTTHSPQVVATARPEWMRIIRPDRVDRVDFVHGRDSNAILREIMGVSERPSWMQKRLVQLERHIENGALESARKLLEEMRVDLGSGDAALMALEWELHDREANGAVDH